ncbi:glucokinase [Halolactibacillus miurensis]|uniref:Glucokinase n=1 Tax=Halolactibacillus miurensis TaxID=306541 RepID=A0A1I6PB53_9BACI|nr:MULTISPECIES: ROK family protein [Halolactibacillus]GEM05907.1 glucokinase [Halolactibacillus miurensis]SFS37434.1 glucokinase [Halolactibacillus miurensis]
MYALGIDIGGTKTAIGLVTTTGDVVGYDKLPTDQTIEPTKMIERIIVHVKTLLEKHRIDDNQLYGIGIGAPGPLDISHGMITYPPNLPRWRNVPVVKLMSAYFSVPIRLENDASCAAVAEHSFGASQHYTDSLYVTISTGIGAGIISKNTLISGGKGNAGDVGHMVIDPSFGECVCGQYGCFEHICSGTAISREASKLKGTSISTEEAFRLYEAQDKDMVPYLDTVIERMGMALVSLINSLDPEIVVIGGGVSQVGDTLFEPIRHYVKRYTLNKDAGDTPIVPAKLNQEAGIIGAAALVSPEI